MAASYFVLLCESLFSQQTKCHAGIPVLIEGDKGASTLYFKKTHQKRGTKIWSFLKNWKET